MRFFVDGEMPGSPIVFLYGPTGGSDTSVLIGTDQTFVDEDAFEGRIDEVRIESAARSSDWIRAQYLSMTDALINTWP